MSSTEPGEVQDTSKYIAFTDYSTDDPRQISFKEGTSLTVVDKSEDGKREELTNQVSLLLLLI